MKLQYLKDKFKIEPFQEGEQWLKSDAEALSTFLTSESGQKLRQKLASRVLQTAVAATLKSSTSYDSGYAGGCRGTVAFIDSHLTITPLESESLDKNDGIENQDAHAIDRYRP